MTSTQDPTAIAIAQLMVVLDLTIVNIALPSAQADLGFSDDARQWIVTAYALAFGSLLLVGGRLGDLFGRKWTFIGGLLGFAVFLFLTFYLQQTKGYSPIRTGLAFLPLTAAIATTATSVNVIFLRRLGPRPLLTLGMLLGAAAMVWLAQLTPSSSYAGHVLPALFVLGIGLGNIFAPAIASAKSGVELRDTGVASAMVNTMQQVGGSIGTAC